MNSMSIAYSFYGVTQIGQIIKNIATKFGILICTVFFYFEKVFVKSDFIKRISEIL